MTRLGIPESWVEEHCRRVDPELFAPCRAERAEVCLSHGKEPRWLFEHRPEDVAEDLRDGIFVERRVGNDGPYWRLGGTRYDVFVEAQVGHRDEGSVLTYVTSVKPARGLGRAEKVRPRDVWFAPAWENIHCDPDHLESLLREGLQVVRRRRAQLDRARRALADAAAPPTPRANLHARVRDQYRPLLLVLKLLEQRNAHERTTQGNGTVLGQDEVEGESVLWLRLDKKGTFAEGRMVAASGPDVANVKLQVLAVEHDGDGPLLAVTAPRAQVDPGTRLSLKQQARFALGKHRAALRRFLDEQVEGDWEHLALLLNDPSQLPEVPVDPLGTYFDRDLSAEQQAAVDGAVGSPHVYHVQGPPGTGKTTVITEVVRQLVARRERVLLLAPMHVAVDEVLGRMAGLPGILALRYSWEDSKVAKDLRPYLPEQAARTYLRNARRPASSQAGRWRAEIARLAVQQQAVENFLTASAHRDQARAQWNAAKAAHAEWGRQITADLDRARADYVDATGALRHYQGVLPPVAQRSEALYGRLRAVPFGRRAWAQVRAALGFPNEVSHLAATHREAAAEYYRLDGEQRAWAARHATTGARLSELDAEWTRGDHAHQATVGRWLAEADKAEAAAAEAAAQLRPLVRESPEKYGSKADLRRLRDRLAGEMRRREQRIALEQRWFELSDLAGGSEEALAKQVEADLLRSANLVGCTTTGVPKDLGDSDFDTLIVDEASRVVDSEFLIGAVRARRWVLVGDEHQLPPYVEPADEHHLHALSALHMVGRGAAPDLDTAVKRLGQLWIEDEELHQFRKETVERTAGELRDTNAWRREYSKAFEDAWQRLRELGEDADKTLLSAMRDHLVRSLFERSVGQVASLRQRLRVQHRSIEPIAALVKGPVYGGDYVTPKQPAVTPLHYGGTSTPVVLVDTSTYGQKAKQRQVDTAAVNDLEAELIARMCRRWEQRLREAGGGRVTVSVLTFYKPQAAEIRRRLGWPDYRDFRVLDFRKGRVDAIDKIQGQQSDLVFVSFCRTFFGERPSANFGRWLQDPRRLNVAVTRARRALVLVGHAPTLRKLNGVDAAEEFYRNLFALLSERADMETVKGV